MLGDPFHFSGTVRETNLVSRSAIFYRIRLILCFILVIFDIVFATFVVRKLMPLPPLVWLLTFISRTIRWNIRVAMPVNDNLEFFIIFIIFIVIVSIAVAVVVVVVVLVICIAR